MRITVLGIDLAKSVFQLHGNDTNGKTVSKRKLRRSELMPFVANLPPCVVAMEACSGAQYWGREFVKLGHEVRLIAPQYVKPFVKTNKNDAADAEAIAEAAMRPNMRFVALKESWQQDWLAVHRARSLLIGQRVALTNAVRGLLAEHGFVFRKGNTPLEEGLKELKSRSNPALSEVLLQALESLWEQVVLLQQQVRKLDQQIEGFAKNDARCVRIQKIEGVGPITATAVVATIGDGRAFKNGRQFSAFLGLVPKQNSSGGKQQLLGISKRGDGYIRRMLIHGARGVAYYASTKETQRSRWIVEKIRTRGSNKTTVALANRNARVIWALLARNEEYRMAA